MKYQKFSHKTPHLKGKQHQLDPNLDLKQSVHHATVQYVDWDVDGDVDEYDKKPKLVPDENPSKDFATTSKKLMAKQKGEVKHTKRGVAYEGTLHKWFKSSSSKDGKPGWVNVVTGGTCASDEPGEGTPKCVSSAKRASMTDAERRSAARRKKAADPGQQQKSGAAKPTYVSTDKPKKKMKEEKEEKRYCQVCQKMETRDECSYGPEVWDKMTVQRFEEAAMKDHEYSMARSELSTVINAAKRLKKKMAKGEGEVEAWVQSKITKAADYLDSAADYVDSGEMKVEEVTLPLRIEIPTNIRDFNLGLMFRESLDENCGMYFIFDEVGQKSFHMTETRIPLDIAFITEEGIVDSIKELEPYDKNPVYSEGEVLSALEVNRGWFEENNVEVGDQIIVEQKDVKGKGSGSKDACYHKVKSRYSVWPSAYASGALVKCRKVGAANWGNKTKKEEFEVIDEAGKKCWKGYKKAGTQKLFGKTYNRCVKEESCPICGFDPCQCIEGNLDEAVRIPSKTGNIILVTLTWRGKYYGIKMFFPQVTKPSRKEVQDQIEKIYPGSKVNSYYVTDIKPGEQFLQTEDWQSVNRKDKTDGLSPAAVKAYRRENPGSKLKTAVTKKPSELKAGSKDAKRRKSFCSRMSGMKKRLTSAKTARDPDSRINKALRRWNCN
jgi:uncharacterized membrane protein (UPF0127 family)/cytochrome c2